MIRPIRAVTSGGASSIFWLSHRDVALQDFDSVSVRAFDKRDVRPWPNRRRLLQHFDALRTELLDGGAQVLDDHAEVVVRITKLFAVAVDLFRWASAADEEIDAV